MKEVGAGDPGPHKPMTLPSPDRASVLWNKGQNFFSAFFVEIGNVRQTIGDDALFARWCLNDLHIPLTVITRVSDVLSIIDAAKVKAELASARAAEQEQRRKEREEREAMAAAERKRKDEEKAAAAAEKARNEELEKQRRDAADKVARKQTSKRKNNAGWKQKQREELKASLAKVTGTNIVPFRDPALVEKSEPQLVKQIKAALTRRDQSRVDWIDASVELAGLLCEARARYPADQKFSHWLDEHEIVLSDHDRAALLKLGQNLEAMRVILDRTDSVSYQHIWRDVQKQIAVA